MDRPNVDVNKALLALPPRTENPRTKSVLDSWIDRAELDIVGAREGRLAWLVATTVACAKLQEVISSSGECRFLLKGGTLLQHRLGLASRASKDLDGLVKGDIDDFACQLDEALSRSWGPIDFSRSPIEEIRVPAKAMNPRRFSLYLNIRGKVWRKIPVEISPDEGRAGSCAEEFPAPNVSAFGIPAPDQLVGLSLAYQIAQKVHAATDPHDPPLYVNTRARDVVDLCLLKTLQEETHAPSNDEISLAIHDIFEARAIEAANVGRTVRHWPARVIAFPHWEEDYRTAAESCCLALSLDEATEAVNSWLDDMARAKDGGPSARFYGLHLEQAP